MSTPEKQTIEKLLRQQMALADFGMFAFREDTLDLVLTEAARVCAGSLGVPFCKVCRFRPMENDLLIVAGVGWHHGVVGSVVSRADKTSPQGRAFITGQPVLIKNLHEINDMLLPNFYREHGIISTMDVPIQSREGPPIGVLEIDSPFEHAYDEHDIIFLTGFTNVLAEAVAKSERTEALRQALAAKDLSIAEKSMMAQELQHRVRNNLQIVHSMLHSEQQQTDPALQAEGLASIARRVVTMSRVYDHLLGVGMSRSIDFGAYLASLCVALHDSQRPSDQAITVICDADPLTLDLDTVTALGMVVAELIANSYKHAFPARRGRIDVTLRHDGGMSAILIVSDDGIGLPAAPTSKRHGLGLAMRLAEQVSGTIEAREDVGEAREDVGEAREDVGEAREDVGEAREGVGTAWIVTFPITPESQMAA